NTSQCWHESRRCLGRPRAATKNTAGAQTGCGSRLPAPVCRRQPTLLRTVRDALSDCNAANVASILGAVHLRTVVHRRELRGPHCVDSRGQSLASVFAERRCCG
ncbi:unnamed protein product, partial [Ixodes pacificus]